MAKGAPWARGRRRLEAAKGRGPPRDKGRHRPWLTKGVGHEERVAMGQREGVAVGARGPRAAESALRPRALVSSHGQRCRHNLAHDSSHDPARDPAHDLARDPAKSGWAVWRSHDLSRDLAG